jgi:Spy/CpxP family protein refolding chaperone
MFGKSFHGSRFCSRRAAAATAAALALMFTGAALGQPGDGHRAPMGAMSGAGEQMIGHLIADAKAKLNLDTSQQVLFDAAVAQGKAARESGRALHQKVKVAMRAELAKTDPNLAAAAGIADDAEQQGRALRLQVRGEWLKLYATFSPDQKAVVRDLLQKRMDRMETFRERMHGRMHDPS